MDKSYITNPTHGGKVMCHKCNGFILEGEGTTFDKLVHPNDLPEILQNTVWPETIWFHTECFNRYEHYYGLDRPID